MAIIGHGDIASVLVDHPDRVYFASGVSNSQEISEAEYKREIDLLLKQPRGAHIVYFSSLAVLTSTTRYARHKRAQEARIKHNFNRYTIIRIGNINWGINPHTLINYLRAHPEAEVRDEFRYIVDQDEFLYWVNLIPEWNCEMNVPGKRMKVRAIVDEYCHVGLPL